MKKYLLGAAAALAFAAPGVALANDATGYVGLGYSTLDDEADSGKDGVFAVEGAVVTSFMHDLNVQLDANLSNLDHSGHTDAFSTVNAHVFHRNDTFAVGGVAGFDNEVGSSLYNLGVEGQFYLPRFTFSGAYTYSNEFDEGNWDIHRVDIDGQFFLTPNTALGAQVGWVDSEWAGEDGFIYGISAEHQFAGSPFSVGARATRGEFDYTGSGGHDVEQFGVFARWNFGTSDLQTRSNSGASMIGGSGVRNGVLTW